MEYVERNIFIHGIQNFFLYKVRMIFNGILGFPFAFCLVCRSKSQLHILGDFQRMSGLVALQFLHKARMIFNG